MDITSTKYVDEVTTRAFEVYLSVIEAVISDLPDSDQNSELESLSSEINRQLYIISERGC